mmetsp:Transcript_7687/g.11640  ORF Transcript_7687/g.11640 Transcript_7687/m.11640 type:complete len:592 (+) Transcript_7687:18-1793(+)
MVSGRAMAAVFVAMFMFFCILHDRIDARRQLGLPGAKLHARRSTAFKSYNQRPRRVERSVNVHASSDKRSAIVVGGGWGGFGALKALSEAGWDVQLLDAVPDPAALNGGWKNKNGRPLEAGFKGFWYQYPNIFSLVDELGLKQEEVFTPFTRSGLYTPKGLFTQAPIFSEFPRLPAPLGQALYTAPLFTDLPLSDRLSISGLLLEMTRYKASPETYEFYDKMTAAELFRRCGISDSLLSGFLRPILLVGLFAPPEELSAAVVMDMLLYYAIAHQADFDVKWARGPISEKLIRPLAESVIEKASTNGVDAQVKGGTRVTEVIVEDGKATSVRVQGMDGTEEVLKADAVVLAVGVTGLKRILAGSPSLAAASPNLRKTAGSMQTIDVMATRLWFDKPIQCQFPANVFANFPELEGAGGTFFCLDKLHDDPWGKDDEPRGAVIAADFYNAGNLLSLPDEEIIRRLTEVLLPAAVPEFKQASLIDTWVQRFPQAVTKFSPGSADSRPPQYLPELTNVVVAGDLVKGLSHGSAGLSQERAYVAGLAAANLLIGDSGQKHSIEEVEEEEPQFRAMTEAAKTAERIVDAVGLSSFLRQ